MRFLTYEGLGADELAPQVEKVRRAIERDDFRSPDVKKLGVGHLYRAKLDDASRLILQFVLWKGERVCLALEVIRQHAYDRSRFLRGAAIDEEKLEAPAAPDAGDARPMRYLHPTRSEFLLLDKPLSLDDTQDAALRHRPPMVLVGSAGSGKTALLLQRLRLMPGRVAYVTESRWLAETSRALYGAHDGAPPDQEADFLSYQQLLETVQVPPGRPVGFREFSAFFERHRQKVPFADAHQVFEELRGVLTSEPEGPLSRDAYLALGVRQSMFDTAQRTVLHDLLERWRQHLTDRGLYEPNLVAHAWLARVEPTYDFLAVDEVQDLTNVQLALVLRALKKEGQFVIAGDANQIVHPNFFAWGRVKSLFWRGLGEARDTDVHILDVSYRNSEAVTRVANGVLRIKHARFGSIDRESNQLMRAVAGEQGSVTTYETGSRAVKELDEKTRLSTRVAVIVLRDEDKAEARRHFRTPLVFSIHEAKGLEYDAVILFRLVASERRLFAELCEGLTPADLAGDLLEYRRARDKADKSLEIYKFFVNGLYVALTRAVRDVHLVEDDVAHPLLALLGIGASDTTAGMQAQRGTAEEWQKEAHRLEAQGKAEQADAIRRQVLQLRPVPWTVLDAPALAALAAKALDPKSIFTKAKQQLWDFACVHEEPLVAARLEEGGFARDGAFLERRADVARRHHDEFTKRSFKGVLHHTELYGVDYRTPMNLTALMHAAIVGNVPLVEALLERGASLDARDHLGRTALHHAIRRAYRDLEYVRTTFGTVYDLVAPASFDVEVDGHLHQIGREQGEYFAFQCLVARYADLYEDRSGRTRAFSSAFLLDAPFEQFPRVVVREERRRREYLNGLLARNEPGSKYRPNRKLWVRERQGSYLPNAAIRLKIRRADGEDAWVPLHELMNLGWLESHVAARAPILAKTPRPPLELAEELKTLRKRLDAGPRTQVQAREIDNRATALLKEVKRLAPPGAPRTPEAVDADLNALGRQLAGRRPDEVEARQIAALTAELGLSAITRFESGEVPAPAPPAPPRSVEEPLSTATPCACGHSGGGRRSTHSDLHGAGLGPCLAKGCECPRFQPAS